MTTTVTLSWGDPEDAAAFLELREELRRGGLFADPSANTLADLVRASETVKDALSDDDRSVVAEACGLPGPDAAAVREYTGQRDPLLAYSRAYGTARLVIRDLVIIIGRLARGDSDG